MESFLFPAAMAIVVFVGFLLLLRNRVRSDEDLRKNAMLEQLSQESASARIADGGEGGAALLKERVDVLPTEGFTGMLARMPGAKAIFELTLKANLQNRRTAFFAGVCMFFLLLLLVFRWLVEASVPVGCILSLIVTSYVVYKYLVARIRRRTAAFLMLFPDATDMMVRSVRAGHALGVAVRMVSENMDEPIRGEFRQVVNEVAYGSSMPEAMARMARRIDSQDVHFFVVVLTVQQETGGSLSEVLSNLSGILRKRKQLRLKINAITSEARAATYILGALPLFEFVLLKLVAGDYLQPMFSTLAGNILLGVAAALIIIAVSIIRKMADFEV